MKKIITVLLLFFAISKYAQTKLIAHKSHSGSNKTFAAAVENNLFDNDNLGLGGMEISDYSKLDSVIYISKNKVILSSSTYTQRRRMGNVCSKDELTQIKRDTLTIKPKSLKNGLTVVEVQANIDSLKMFQNFSTKTIFKDFDEKSKRKINRKKKSFLPFLPNFPNIPNSFILVAILGVLSTLIYLILSNLQIRKISVIN